MKFSLQHARQAAQRVKSGIAGSYHTAMKIAGGIDHGLTVAKRLYGAIAPMLDEFGVSHRPAMKALTTYEDFKRKAIDVHDLAETTANRVRRTVPELGL